MLQLAMTKVRAWEQLNDPSYAGNLTMGRFKELMLEAGYSEEQAQRAANQRGWARLDAGVSM